MNNTAFSLRAAHSPAFFQKPATLLHRIHRGSLLWVVILAASLGFCRGEDLAVTFSPATQAANPGDVVTFQGTIRNNGTTALYLNANAIDWSLRNYPILPTTFDLLPDDEPFATGVPVKLAPGEEWTGNLFRVTVGIDAPATNYDGTLSVLGGPTELPFDVQGTGTFHLTVTGTAPVADPTAPGSLTATASGANVAITWVDLADNEEGFSIEQATDGGAYTVIALVGGDRQHYLVGGLNPAHVYFYRIRAFNGFNTLSYSAFSNVVAAQVNETAEATSAAGAVVNFAAIGVTGLSYSSNSGTTFPLGTTPVTFSATDLDSNTAGGAFSVTVLDTTAPLVAAHADVFVEATSAAGAIATYAPGSATDAVTANPAITYSKNSGTLFPLGGTFVTIKATDAANNTGPGVFFNVVVEDTTAPVVAAHADVTVDATSPSGAIVNYSPATATDAVGVQSLTYSQNSGTNFPIGTTTVTVTATDGTNNTGTASFTVTVSPLTLIQSWRFAHYGTAANTGNAADTADPYNTGIPNLLAYAFFEVNQDPALAAISQLPQVQMADGNLFFSFTEPAGVGGVTYGADWRLTLDSGTWEAIPDAGTGTLHFFSVPIDSNPQMFIRLRVSSP